MKGPSPEVGMDEIPNRPKVGVSLRGKGGRREHRAGPPRRRCVSCTAQSLARLRRRAPERGGPTCDQASGLGTAGSRSCEGTWGGSQGSRGLVFT